MLVVTNTIVRKLIGLAPIRQQIPELIAAVSAPRPRAKKAKPGCKQCPGETPQDYSDNLQKIAVPIIMGLSQAKKDMILRILGTPALQGYMYVGEKYVLATLATLSKTP